MKNAYVIIDGAYLSLLCKYFGNGKYIRLNIKKFSEYLCKKEKINCGKYFIIQLHHIKAIIQILKRLIGRKATIHLFQN